MSLILSTCSYQFQEADALTGFGFAAFILALIAGIEASLESHIRLFLVFSCTQLPLLHTHLNTIPL